MKSSYLNDVRTCRQVFKQPVVVFFPQSKLHVKRSIDLTLSKQIDSSYFYFYVRFERDIPLNWIL